MNIMRVREMVGTVNIKISNVTKLLYFYPFTRLELIQETKNNNGRNMTSSFGT